MSKDNIGIDRIAERMDAQEVADAIAERDRLRAKVAALTDAGNEMAVTLTAFYFHDAVKRYIDAWHKATGM